MTDDDNGERAWREQMMFADVFRRKSPQVQAEKTR